MYDTETPSSTTFKGYIEEAARRAIKSFVGTIDENGVYLSPIYPGAASMGESIAADYHGRFLIELIQNANDVHPNDRSDGEIEVLLDQSAGEFGVLYVANRGKPFATKNVDALRNMGLSSKPPGEAIGNKGLGFRSVGHICDSPEIYSQAEDAPGGERFAGFCFRFAQADDLDALFEDPRHCELARADLPIFHIPIWLADQSDRVTAYAQRGFATVIALPVRSEAASQDILAEIAELQAQKAPMLLFLPRLARLAVRVVDRAGTETEALSLERREEHFGDLSIADLGVSGRYLIARSRIAEAVMKDAVVEGVGKKQLHKDWLKWEGGGEVALAVRLDGVVATPRLYTFLPMGVEAAAPFPGHLHGSFFPSSNRKILDASVRLNAILLKAAAHLAADTAAKLVDVGADPLIALTSTERACVVADLLCWRKVDSLQTQEDLPAEVGRRVAAGVGAANLSQARIVPILSVTDGVEGIGWGRPSTARRWTFAGQTFTTKVAAAHGRVTGADPIWPGLEHRAQALTAYLSRQIVGYSEAAGAAERGALAVQVAKDLAGAKRFVPERWAAYYKDLVELLDKAGTVLAGKPVLLCADGELRTAMVPTTEVQSSTGRRKRSPIVAAVFSPPARRGADADTEQLSPPQSLADHFAFLSDRLDWHGELADARSFLQKHGLVLEFDRETILNQLSRVVRADARAATRSAGLRWAFQIWRRPQETGRTFQLQPTHRFYVPTMDAQFIEASEAIFSESWPDETRGRLLQRFLNAAPTDSADIAALAKRRLAPKAHYAFRGGSDIGLWVKFLTQLGVKRGLFPTKQTVPGRLQGWRVREMTFCNALGFSPDGVAAWKADIRAENPSAMSLTSSDYYIRGEILWMPGQGDILDFKRECLEYYAQLVIAWLGEPQPVQWDLNVHHYHFIHDDARSWPTPLKSFLRSAAWIPADEPSVSGTRKVAVRVSDIWMGAEAGDRFPSFLRRPAVPLMRALEAATPAQIQALRKRGELHVFDDADSLLEQADFLARQYAGDGFDRYFERRLLNLYFSTWRRAAERFDRGQLESSDLWRLEVLLARKVGDVEIVRPDDAPETEAEPLYVRDTDDETIVSLLDAGGRVLFDARSDHARIGKLMRALYGPQVRLTSEVDYTMSVDGGAVGDGDVVSFLERWPRLRLMVAVAMEALRGAEAQRLPADRQVVIERLGRVLFQSATTIGFKIDGHDVDQDTEGRNAFALKIADGRPIVVCRSSGPTTWGMLDEALSALCEAIEQTVLEPLLRILLLQQRAAEISPSQVVFTDLDLEDMCSALRLSRMARRAVRETLGAGLERHLPWLKALLHMAGGRDAVDALVSQEAEALKDIAALRKVVSPWLVAIELDTDDVLEACKTSLTVAELREALGLDFETLNLALQAVGEKPDTYLELHAALVAGYVATHDLEITDLLRAAYAPTLKRGAPAPDYALAREAAHTLTPDADWSLRYKEVPEAIIKRRVDEWLLSLGARPVGSDPSEMATLDSVRRANGVAVKVFVEIAGPLVRAWSRTRSAPHQIWREADGGVVGLRGLLDQAGVFDWRVLDQADLLTWTNIIGAWPAGMDLTLDRSILKIVEKDLNEEQAKARAEAEARKKAARSVPFNGRPVDPEEVDWSALEAELQKSLPPKFLNMPLGRKASLAPARGNNRGTGGSWSSGGGGGGGTGYDVPSQKTDFIGRLGELAVRHWLMRRLPEQNIDVAWKSKIGEQFTGRPGSDGLGYDFEVTVGRQLWQIEVKSSLNDPLAFKLGETEVKAGRAAARARSGVQYWIAYVSNLSIPAQARVELLPNPMSEEGEAVLNLLGQGLRFGFSRSLD